jgi:RND family efflux transporter MFP subunit
MVKRILTISAVIALLFVTVPLSAQEKKPQGMPPARVVVAAVSSGMVAPEGEFVGTVYYQEVSEVASEVEGLVKDVRFEEGQRVDAGTELVNLGSDLLRQSLKAAEASYEQTLEDLKKARKDLERADNLFKEELISEQSYDEKRFAVSSLEKKASALKADAARLNTELLKKDIRAPFSGIVIKKHVDRGEWLDKGSVIATLGKDDVVDIIVEVPESVIRYLKPGREVRINAGSRNITGKIITLIPRGDTSTRTFPVKIRIENKSYLIEGMEARVQLPIGTKEEALMVPRDAVITVMGQTVVYTVNDSSFVMRAVRIVGYERMTVGIQAEGLKEGMQVIIKGNERLRPGQPVMIQE